MPYDFLFSLIHVIVLIQISPYNPYQLFSSRCKFMDWLRLINRDNAVTIYRGGSRAVATSKMEFFAIIVNGR